MTAICGVIASEAKQSRDRRPGITATVDRYLNLLLELP
jgi:hypothetical protein